MRTLPRQFKWWIAALVAAAAVVLAIVMILVRPASSTPSVAVAASPAPSAATATPTPSQGASSPQRSAAPTATPLPLGVADLTGEHVDDAVAHRLPIAVLIDDNRVARPQSGFNAASVIYQAPADGGETRYLLVYQEGDSNEVGPVRSGRLYFIQWACETRAAIAHYGGDRVTRTYLLEHDRDWFTDIDALRTISSPFHRVSARRPPHNAYTSTTALRSAISKLGGPAVMPIDVQRRRFVDPTPAASLPARQTVRVPYATVRIDYVFDPLTDLYVRRLDGRAQLDPADAQVVTTRNVVILFMSFRIDPTIEPGHNRPVIGDIGTGKAIVINQGHATAGTWRKDSDTAPTLLLDASGNEIPLVRGRTFIQIVSVGTKVVVSP
jgi:hypothetical protein